MKNYTIISGTGRAGTTLLVRILMKAGIDAGFDPDTAIDPVAHAGLELDLRTKPDCRLVKSPWIAAYIDEVVEDEGIKIEHAIICMRNLYDAAESRRRVQRARNTDEHVLGGLVGVRDPADQEAYLAELFHQLVLTLSANAVPMTFLHFPLFARDVEYFVETIHPIFQDVSVEDLRTAYHEVVAPSLISDFSGTRPPSQDRSTARPATATTEEDVRAHREKVEAALAALNALVADQRIQIAGLAAQVSQTAGVSQALARRNQESAALSRDLASAWGRIAELDRAVKQLTAGKLALEHELNKAREALQASELARATTDQRLQALDGSLPQKLMQPLRALRRVLMGPRDNAN